VLASKKELFEFKFHKNLRIDEDLLLLPVSQTLGRLTNSLDPSLLFGFALNCKYSN
jgi:hypothetical protein